MTTTKLFPADFHGAAYDSNAEYEIIVGGVQTDMLPRRKGVKVVKLGRTEVALYGTYGDLIAYGVKVRLAEEDPAWFVRTFVTGARRVPFVAKKVAR